jgi:hypothetical protein
MESRITGTTMPVLEFLLTPNESIISEAGELSWMGGSIQMTTHRVTYYLLPEPELPLIRLDSRYNREGQLRRSAGPPASPCGLTLSMKTFQP